MRRWIIALMTLIAAAGIWLTVPKEHPACEKTEDIRDGFGLVLTESVLGAEVYAVEQGSPANISGIFPGDVLTELDGVRFGNSELASSRLDAVTAGAELTLIRDGQQRTLKVRR